MNALRIIIADDQPAFREELEKTLLRLMPSATIYLVTTGKEMLELLRTKFVELIFLNFRMPEKDGMALTKSIRKENDQVKIIALTGNNDTTTADQLLSAGVNACLEKDQQQAMLEQVIEELMISDK
jgi:CheY-like chemotaxis protein